MSFSKKAKTALVFSLICVLISAVLVFATPGDNNDPLVTLTYITDILLPDIDGRIDRKINAAKSASSGTFKLVNVRAGKVIYGDEGTEFVLRSGGATVIAGSGGGIADLTAGCDLSGDSRVPFNHHLLIPRTDSRGLYFVTESIILVKGNYSVN